MKATLILTLTLLVSTILSSQANPKPVINRLNSISYSRYNSNWYAPRSYWYGYSPNYNYWNPYGGYVTFGGYPHVVYGYGFGDVSTAYASPWGWRYSNW